MKNFIVCVCVIVFFGCAKDSSPIDDTELLWKSLYTDGFLANSFKPIVAGDVVLYGRALAGGGDKVLAFNKKTGEKLWEWAEWFEQDVYLNGGDRYYLFDGIFVVARRGSVYAIVVDDGSTLWRSESLEGGYDSVGGIGSTIFNVKRNGSSLTLFKSGLLNPDWESVYTLNSPNLDTKVAIRYPIAHVIGGDTMLFFISSEYYFPTYSYTPVVNCFNMTNSSMVWQDTIATDDGTTRGVHPLVYNDRLYVDGDEMSCYDLLSGELLWRKKTFGTVNAGNFIIADDLLFLSSRELIPQVYALNPLSGHINWSIDCTTAISRLDYHNGTLYYADNRMLNAVDGQTGAVLWGVESPDGNESNVSTSDVCTVDSETGFVYTADGKNALCYRPPE